MPAQTESSQKQRPALNEKLVEKVTERVLELMKEQARLENERKGHTGRSS